MFHPPFAVCIHNPDPFPSFLPCLPLWSKEQSTDYMKQFTRRPVPSTFSKTCTLLDKGRTTWRGNNEWPSSKKVEIGSYLSTPSSRTPLRLRLPAVNRSPVESIDSTRPSIRNTSLDVIRLETGSVECGKSAPLLHPVNIPVRESSTRCTSHRINSTQNRDSRIDFINQSCKLLFFPFSFLSLFFFQHRCMIFSLPFSFFFLFLFVVLNFP